MLLSDHRPQWKPIVSMIRSKYSLAVVLLLACSPFPANAELRDDLHPLLGGKIHIDLGPFFPNKRLRLGVDGSANVVQPLIDFNEELGLKSADKILSLDVGWRFANRWLLTAQYFESANNSAWQLEEDIEWEDLVFPAGSYAASGSGFSLTSLFVGRALDTKDRHEIGFGIGLHLIKISAYIEGTLIEPGGEVRFDREAVRTDAPLPNIGAWYKYSISPNWAFRARLHWIDASIDNYDGRVTNLSFGLNWRISEHFGLGLNYNDFELDLKVRETDWRGRVINRHDGLFLHLSGYW